MTTTHDIPRRSPAFLVVLDIDGTIAVPGTTDVSDVVRGAVAEVRAAGHHVVLGSGRSLVGMLPIARTLGLTESWMVASNGAVTARLAPRAPRGYLLHDVQTFDPGPVVTAVRSAFPGVRVATEVVGKGYRVTRLFAPNELNGDQKIVDVVTVSERRTTRLILSAPGVTDLLEELRHHEVTVNPDGDSWLDITPHGLSKATALDKVRSQLDVEAENTIAVGDGINDIQLLTWAHRGVAMEHAPAEVRAAADDVTGSLAADGAAAVLRLLLLQTVPAGR